MTASPDEAGNRLSGVSCAGTTYCVAVGSAEPSLDHQETLIESWDGSSWSVMPSPDPGSNNSLDGVSCPSSSFCVAVGSQWLSGNLTGLIEMWDGSSWSEVSSPLFAYGDLSGVSCLSTTDCTAVGSYWDSAATAYLTLVESWNGTSWSVVSSPNLGVYPGSGGWGATNTLSGVSCTSPTSCIAVGASGNGGASPATQTLAESWDGASWTVSASSNSTTNDSLSGVSCAAATTCMAVGYTNGSSDQTLAESWNGTAWALAPTPDPSTTANVLNGVSCTASTACVAAGYDYSSGYSESLIESWNGTRWSHTHSANGAGQHDSLAGVSCPVATGCLSAGYDNSGYDVTSTLVESWNGSAWSIAASPNPQQQENQLNGISCAGTTFCVAVGSTAFETLGEVWNGHKWSTSYIPDGSVEYVSGDNTLQGVSCASPTFCVAVGDYINPLSSINATLVDYWNDVSGWSVVSSPDQGSGNNGLNGVSCPSPTYCVAVGSYDSGSGYQTLIETWNGTWSIQTSPNQGGGDNTLEAVSCSSSTSCVAVGQHTTGSGYQTLVESWNGISWSLLSSPNPSSIINWLTSVSCVSTTRCVAAGWDLNTVSGAANTLVETWNGSDWSQTPSPSRATGNSALNGLSCASPTSCSAVGYSSNEGSTLAESWNGHKWSIVSSPSPANQTNVLDAVSCTSTTTCVAAGYDRATATGSQLQTLIETGSVPAPKIAGFTPSSGPVGTLVTITGTGLADATTVKFNGTAATVSSDTSTQIKTTVPTGATTGQITVTTTGGTATSTSNFTIT